MNYPRVCVIGAGYLSSLRIYPYLGLAGAQLVGTCDLDLVKAEGIAARYGGHAYQDVRRMLEAESPDGVMICIGPSAHAELATSVLRLGYPVYTEKPPASTAAEALRVARVAQETGLPCSTAFKKRYADGYLRAREWIEAQAAENLLSISIDYASGAYSNTDERSDFLLDFAIHAIDLIAYLGGDAEEVCCYAKGRSSYAVALRFVSGAVGTLCLSDGRSFRVPTEEVELTAVGGNFMTIHNSSCWRISAAGNPTEWREPPTFVSAGDSGRDTGHLSEIEAFIRVLANGGTTPSNICESYKTMVLYEAIRAAAAERRPVPVQYEQP